MNLTIVLKKFLFCSLSKSRPLYSMLTMMRLPRPQKGSPPPPVSHCSDIAAAAAITVMRAEITCSCS